MKIPCSFNPNDSDRNEFLDGYILGFVPADPCEPQIVEVEIEPGQKTTLQIHGPSVLAVIQCYNRILSRPISDIIIKE